MDANNLKSFMASIISFVWRTRGIYLTLEIIQINYLVSQAKITRQCHCLSPSKPPWPGDPPCFLLHIPSRSFPVYHFHHFMILRSSILSDSIPGLQDHLGLARNADIQTADHFGFVNSKAIYFSVLPMKQKESNKTQCISLSLDEFFILDSICICNFHLCDGLWHMEI